MSSEAAKSRFTDPQIPPEQRHSARKSFTSALSTTFEGMELDTNTDETRPIHTSGVVPGMKFPRRQSVSVFRGQPRENVAEARVKKFFARGAAPQFQPVHGPQDLSPLANHVPKYRRAAAGTHGSNGKYISPLRALTTSISDSYLMCNPNFDYEMSRNPRRALTVPSEPKFNHGHDNKQHNYILYVNDVIGTEDNRKYMAVDVLGYGEFGQVVKCQNLDTQEIVAVKIVKCTSFGFYQSLAEAKILNYLNTKVDPNDKHHILRMKDKFMHKNHLCLVFELLSSNLYELLRQNQFNGLRIKLIRELTIQLLEALCVLKDADIIHCDLKPENILLVSLDRLEIKVVDFGTACHERQAPYRYVQSRFYRSPELILGLSFNASIDMWSLGCVVAELFLGYPLFAGTSEYNQLCRIVWMLGMPPTWMIDLGKNSYGLFNKQTDIQTRKNTYTLRTPEEYSRLFRTNVNGECQHFRDRYLEDIILNYRISKKDGSPSRQLSEKEMQSRLCLADFLKGTLNLNPLERWTPQEALMHPFITGKPFTGTWAPPTRRHNDS